MSANLSAFVIDEDEDIPAQPAAEAAPRAAEIAPPPVILYEAQSNPLPGVQGSQAAAGQKQDTPVHSTLGSRAQSCAALFQSSSSTLADVIAKVEENKRAIQDTELRLQELLDHHTALMQAERALEQQEVLRVLSSAPSLGCHKGRPLAALLIHRCCLHWQLFDNPDAGPVLEQISQALSKQALACEVASQVADEQGQEHDAAAEHLAYWLSTVTTLLALIHKFAPLPQQLETQQCQGDKGNAAATFGKISAEVSSFQKKFASTLQSVSWKGLLSRKDKGKVATSEGAHAAEVKQLSTEAEQPAHAGTASAAAADQASAPVQAFRLQLDKLAVQLYSELRDHLKRQLAPLLSSCVQAPTLGASLSSPLPSPTKLNGGSTLLDEGQEGLTSPSSHARSSAGPEGQRLAAMKPWAELVAALHGAVAVMQEQGTPRILIKCIMKQVLNFINTQMFNQLLLRPECCSSTNARYVSEGLQRVDAWLVSQAEETAFISSLQPELRHIHQAAAFLVTANKGALTLPAILQMCPALNMQQIYRLCTTYWDDAPPPQPPPKAQPAPATEEGQVSDATADEVAESAMQRSSSAAAPIVDMVSGEVLEELKRQPHVSGNGGLIVTFLLDEDHQAVIAPQGSRVALEVLALIDDTLAPGRGAAAAEAASAVGDLYVGMPIPQALLAPGVPREPFEFLERDVAW